MPSTTCEPAVSALLESVTTTFAEMAFIDVSMCADPPESVQYSHILRISFTKPITGEIAVFLPTDCKQLVVENIYGTEWDALHASEIDDCLLELLNVLGGNFLAAYSGTTEGHELSLPELVFDEEGLGERENAMDVYFDAEDRSFRATISVQRKTDQQTGKGETT